MSEIEREIEAMMAELEPAAGAGDAKAQYELSGLCHDMAMRRHSWEYFKKAEAFIRSSADAGYLPAVDRLRDWAVLRYALERHIQRASAA